VQELCNKKYYYQSFALSGYAPPPPNKKKTMQAGPIVCKSYFTEKYPSKKKNKFSFKTVFPGLWD
jgi:hypothetical protein